MCVLSIKVPIRKKSGNLFNDPRIIFSLSFNALYWVWNNFFLLLRVFGLLYSSVLLFPQRFGRYILRPSSRVCSLNFWDKAWWFLSLRVFGLLSSSLLLFPQRFSRYVLRPSSGVCRTREPSRNFELRPLLNPRVSPVLIPLAITGYKW